MNFDEPDHLRKLRTDLREYFAGLLDDDTRAALVNRATSAETTRRLVRQLGADGWLGIGWPVEYGGGGWGPMAQLVLFDEVLRADAPYPLVTINTVGPALIRYGTEEQKQRFLPGIMRGEIHFAIGYTEPQAGTDLASLRTRAVRDGERYIVNGNKVFTSGMDVADWVWLACRTDPDAPKHAGISILLVDATSPGVSWTPIETIGGVLTSASYYDDVEVPLTDLVAGEGDGWRLITTQLNHERVTLAANSGLAFELFDGIREWAATTPSPSGGVVLDESWVRHDLGRAHARLEAVRLLNWRMASAMETSDPGPAQSSLVKVFSTESLLEVYRLLLGIVGASGHLPYGSPGAVLAGRLERAGRRAQVNTFGGGVNEIQRELLVSHALGVRGRPRSS